jgi:cation transport regulator ChaC
MSRIAVFAYGSLVSRESAARTLGRPFPRPTPVQLPGWRRRWSAARDNLAVEKTFARAGDGQVPGHVVGLNLERSEYADAAPNGALVELSEGELDRLDLREMRYDRADVTAEANVAGDGERFDLVVAYVAKPVHYAPEPPPDSVVLATYVRTIEAAFAALGPRELDRFRETTGPPPVEVIEPVLVRDEIPPGNPREW